MATITSPRASIRYPSVVGLVLAAGRGSRYGGPKALARDADGTPWLSRAVHALRQGGCAPVVVVLGAGADEAEALLDRSAEVLVVHAEDWAAGLAASLRAGLGAVAALVPEPTAVVVVPVDVPDLSAELVARLTGAHANGPGTTPVDDGTLRRAVFHGQPGHPVVLGRRHWAPLLDGLTGDSGARAYLAARQAVEIECADLGTGLDVDRS
ncbi:nucleotidyltransferase family protein [Pengzhenrongella frigida]|uniref:Nucleotidyltransferase family protein n=1 Tax=Pengzhenrongella frigida TaxID=1259133 RepID=A0A4Q5N0R1_9MICO|nr:nucleotidyltransferase family protein [Cellulomonas sp. HLT2-17]RYV50087.1 nucleotidyltransferase family protein [Cellulomonas sp. HLT2-17]